MITNNSFIRFIVFYFVLEYLQMVFRGLNALSMVHQKGLTIVFQYLLVKDYSFTYKQFIILQIIIKQYNYY